MRTACAALVAAIAVAAFGCDDNSKSPDPHPAKPKPAVRLAACIEAWNQAANFDTGTDGAVVRRLERHSVDALFAHVSRDRAARCVVFVDTLYDVDDRRFIRSTGGFELDCRGPCGDQAPAGSRTLRFRENGTLPG
jgi:hypothetical protein